MELFLHSDGSVGKRTKALGVLGVFHALATSVIQLREVPLCAWGTSCLGYMDGQWQAALGQEAGSVKDELMPGTSEKPGFLAALAQSRSQGWQENLWCVT